MSSCGCHSVEFQIIRDDGIGEWIGALLGIRALQADSTTQSALSFGRRAARSLDEDADAEATGKISIHSLFITPVVFGPILSDITRNLGLRHMSQPDHRYTASSCGAQRCR